MWLRLLLLAIAGWIAYRYIRKLIKQLSGKLNMHKQIERCPNCGESIQLVNDPLKCPQCGQLLARGLDGKLIIRVN